MLPIEVAVEVEEALQDQEITTTEVLNIMETIFGSVLSAIVMAFGMVMFYRVIKGDNPGHSNPGPMTPDIVERARLVPYIPPSFVPREEDEEVEIRKRKPPTAVRTREVGPYVIRMERRDGQCRLKLYENLPGWKRNLVATQTADSYAECDRLFEKVVETVVQVRHEHKTALRR